MGRLSTESLARSSIRKPRITIAIWLLLFIVALFLIATLLGSATTTEMTFSNDQESLRAFDLARERFGREAEIKEVVIVNSSRFTVDDPEFKAYMLATTGRILGLGDDVVSQAVNHYIVPADAGVPEESFVSTDRHTAIIQVTMAGELTGALDNIDRLHEATVSADAVDGFEVFITGDASIAEDFNKTAEETLLRGEGFGIPIAIMILVVIFGALAASSLPLLLSGLAILMALGITAVTGQVWDDLSFFVTNMITMMGLAVGIDYALFIISRFREERRLGLDKDAAILRASATASNAVFFSGLTVILALMGLMIVPMSLFQSLAAGAIFVVSMAIIATVTLLPALLHLVGDRIDSPQLPLLKRLLLFWLPAAFAAATGLAIAAVPVFGLSNIVIIAAVAIFGFIYLITAVSSLFQWLSSRRVAREQKGFWDWESRVVMKHPAVSLIIGAGILLALAYPGLDIRTGQSKVEDLSHDLVAVQGLLVLKEDFPFAFTSTPEVVIDGDIDSRPVQDAISRFQLLLAEDPLTFGPTKIEVNNARDLAVIKVPTPYDPASREATDVVERLRSTMAPAAFADSGAEVLLTGQAAFNLDYYNLTDSYRPIVFSFVLGLSFILLTVVFRSLIVPLKAIIMNLLSVFASYGLLVLIFQKGYGNELFHFRQVETIDAWIPLFLFAILFGLSMDYHVFLLSRIRERYLETGENSESVAFGIRSTGGIITGAALIMVVIFGSFASGSLVTFQQMGFGMAVAVLLDATIIRSIVVPASMRLLGDWNWYLPRWLQWLPELHIEGRQDDGAR